MSPQVIKLVWKLGLDGISLEINGQDLGLIGGPYLVKQVQCFNCGPNNIP